MQVTAIVVAAGVGSRMSRVNDSTPKPLLPILGKPMLAHTLLAFENVDQISDVVLVVPGHDRETVRAMVEANPHIKKVASIVPGGSRRQDSTAAGLAHVPDGTDLVVIHDGVRPLVKGEEITAVIAAAESTGAALLALKCVDTVKRIAGGRVLHTLDRTGLWLAQTPQAFEVDLLERALARAESDGVTGTDEAALVERLGEAVEVVEGTAENLKITTQSDLALAEFYLGRDE